MLAGRGVRGQVGDQMITIGSHRLFDEQFPHSDTLCHEVGTRERDGQTTMLLAANQEVKGYIALADTPRDSSKQVIAD